MQLPSWLAGLTGADKFANNPANGFQANLGDMAQAAGHSMLQHYRGQGGTYGGNPLIEGLNGSVSTPMPQQEPDFMSALAPLGASINGGSLPSVQNPTIPPEAQRPAPVAAPQPQGPAWGQQGLAGIPLPLLLQMGLRGF